MTAEGYHRPMPLTERQRRVLEMLDRGLSLSEIARRLGTRHGNVQQVRDVVLVKVKR